MHLSLALYQNNSVPLDAQGQFAALEKAAQSAAMANASLLVTPELFISGYKIPGKVESIARRLEKSFTGNLSAIAKQAGIAILCGYPEHTRAGVYNSAVLVDREGARLLNHRKLHLSGAYEKGHFIVDSNTVQVAEISGVRVAPLICYDVEFPEAVRACALAGADLVAVPTALADEFAFLTRTLVPTRAFENGLFVAYVNHAGSEADVRYCGLSTLARPDGSFVQTAGAEEELLIVKIDTEEIAAARARLPYLDDRRDDMLQIARKSVN